MVATGTSVAPGSSVDAMDVDAAKAPVNAVDDMLGQVTHMRVHPQYLNSNSTSHVWPLGAIAELVDNAQDPDCGATKLDIDVDFDEDAEHREPLLMFKDDGKGCSKSTLEAMLSMGYCTKDQKNAETIGRYGNGFKSGTMRLGNDVIVFTRTQSEASLGFLSQTFLEDRQAQEVLTPIVTWTVEAGQKMTSQHFHELAPADPSQRTALELVMYYSPFRNAEEKACEYFNRIEKTGTIIVVYTLKRDLEDDIFELDFDEVSDDIVLAKRQDEQGRPVRYGKGRDMNEHLHSPLAIDYSLRAYLAVLYLHPRITICLRGKVVRIKRVAMSLLNAWRDTYTPRATVSKENPRLLIGSTLSLGRALPNNASTELAPVEIIFGMNADASEPRAYGMMLYHRGRLIKSYQKIGIQAANNDGRGMHIIGVLSADHLTPTHNKQDFFQDRQYNTLMSALAKNLLTYYQVKVEPYPQWRKYKPMGAVVNWVACDLCHKWRRLPDSVPMPDHNMFWECSFNADYVGFTSQCNLPDDPEVAIESRRQVVQKRRRDYELQLQQQLQQQQQQRRQIAERTTASNPQALASAESVAVSTLKSPSSDSVVMIDLEDPSLKRLRSSQSPEKPASSAGLAGPASNSDRLRALKQELHEQLTNGGGEPSQAAAADPAIWNKSMEEKVSIVPPSSAAGEGDEEESDEDEYFDMTVPSKPALPSLLVSTEKSVEVVLENLFWTLYQKFIRRDDPNMPEAEELTRLDVEQFVGVITKNIEYQVEAKVKEMAELRAKTAVANSLKTQSEELEKYISIVKQKNHNYARLKEYCAGLQQALVAFSGKTPEELMQSRYLKRFAGAVLND